MIGTRSIAITENRSFGGDSGNDSIPVGRGAAFESFELVISAKNGVTQNVADGALAQTVIESISKIEIAAGSRVFRSGSAEIMQAFNAYRDGTNPAFDYTQVAGAADPVGYQRVHIPIPFTAYSGELEDHQRGPIHGLPAPLYDSLDFNIEYDFTISGSAGFVTATPKMDIFANIMPKLSDASLRAMKVIEINKKQDYTTVASGTHPLDMTISPDRQLRQVLVHCYDQGVREGVPITHLNLEVDHESQRYIKWKNLQFENARDCKLNYIQSIRTQALGTDDEIWTRIPDVEPTFTAQTTTSEDVFLTVAGDAVTINGQTAGDLGTLNLRSQVIPCTAIMDFDRSMSGAGLLNQGKKNIRMIVTNGGASGALSIHEMSVVAA